MKWSTIALLSTALGAQALEIEDHHMLHITQTASSRFDDHEMLTENDFDIYAGKIKLIRARELTKDDFLESIETHDDPDKLGWFVALYAKWC